MNQIKSVVSKFLLSTGFAAMLLFSSNTALAGVRPTSVPEPGPLGLLVLGAVGILLSRRISRNK